ncbi:hypothetical protein LEP1GSC170_1341 [Leptospira interrogans serovar Bataviae str. HAI135]|nr:hypothetical protein LEP1GSC170_1341 [Leptospira interrogans serovar Bataviae str. HAI135]
MKRPSFDRQRYASQENGKVSKPDWEKSALGDLGLSSIEQALWNTPEKFRSNRFIPRKTSREWNT